MLFDAQIGEDNSPTANTMTTTGLTTTGSIAVLGAFTGNTETAITAHAGGTQAAAYALTKMFNIIGVCATTADSVRLPATPLGKIIIIYNNGAAAAQMYGAGTDTIDLVATATGVPLTNGKWAILIGNTAVNWVSFGGAGHSV